MNSQPAAARKSGFIVAAALTLTAAAYIQSLAFGFVYDDYNQILYNPLLRAWRYLPSLFTSPVWNQLQGLSANALRYYRPIFMSWLLVNWHLFGSDPTAWHAATIALHLAVTALVFYVGLELGLAQFLAGAAALLFGLHPVHVEAVDWVSGGSEPLFTLFFLGSFLCFLRLWRTPADNRSSTSLLNYTSWILYAIALFTKETSPVLPVLVFLYAWLFPRSTRKFPDAFVAALPYLFIASFYLVARLFVLGALTSVRSTEQLEGALLLLPFVLVFYIFHMIVPVHLSPFYSLPTAHLTSLTVVLMPGLALLLLGILIVRLSRRSHRLAFLMSWSILLLLPPVVNFVAQANTELVQDRYLYGPSMAYCILVAILLGRIRPLWATQVAVAVVALSAGWLTISEGQYWRDGITLNQRGLEISPGNLTAMQNLGVELVGANRPIEALPYLKEVVNRDPRNEAVLFVTGLAYLNLDKPQESETFFRRAAAVNYGDPKVHLFLARSASQQQHFPEAEHEARIAISQLRYGGGNGYHLTLANILEHEGNLPEALREYRQELTIDPSSAEAIDAVTRLRAQTQ